jgi:serine/threonine protein kinase
MYQEVSSLRVLHSAGANVPGIFEDNVGQFEDPDVPLYFVMTYVAGKTLADTIKEKGTLPLESSVAIALDLCDTMAIAVKEGITHRDIKPENLIVTSIDPVCVTVVDFGLSFNEDDTSELTDTDETLDNKFLSLPERRGPGENKRDFRSDITGICAILYYCLTGISPRDLRSSQGKAPHRRPGYSLDSKITNEKQRSALNMLLDRGLSHEIDSRFQTVEELTHRLKEIINPDFQAPAEDLDTVLARESAAIRRSDRRVQLAECRSNVSNLPNRFAEFVNELARRAMTTQRVFNINWQGAEYGSNEKLSTGEHIMSFAIQLYVPAHQRQFTVRYTISSSGAECAVHREFGETVQNKFSPQGGPTLVTRYPIDADPDSETIFADISPAIAKAIVTVSGVIQNGS